MNQNRNNKGTTSLKKNVRTLLTKYWNMFSVSGWTCEYVGCEMMAWTTSVYLAVSEKHQNGFSLVHFYTIEVY